MLHSFTVLDLSDYGHELMQEHETTIKHLLRCDLVVSHVGRPSVTLYSTDARTISRFEDIIGPHNVKAYEIISYNEPEDNLLKF